MSDAVALGGELRGKAEVGLERGMDAIERLALLDRIADLLEEVDAGALVDGRAGQPRDARQPEAVDRRNHAVARGHDVVPQVAERRRSRAAGPAPP